MNIKTILLGAAMLSTLSGTGFAGALDNPGTATPFFSGGGMKSVKSEARLAMTDTGWAMSNECSDRTIDKQHNDLCKTTKQLGGAN